MSVVKSKRTPSRFEVLHNLFILRREINELLLYDFSYSEEKARKKLLRNLGISSIEEMDEKQRKRYEYHKRRWDAFNEWLVVDERKVVLDSLRDATQEIFLANSIYPVYWQELMERRIHQDRAIGHCERLLQELFYVISTLPVDHNIYTRFASVIGRQIYLLKQWRKSDNNFRATILGAQIEPQNIETSYVYRDPSDIERKASEDYPYVAQDIKDGTIQMTKAEQKSREWGKKVYGDGNLKTAKPVKKLNTAQQTDSQAVA